jgi:heme a synthase
MPAWPGASRDAGRLGAVTPATRLAWLRRMAFVCALLMLAVTLLSAFVRLSSMGPGCEPWPACHAERPALAERYRPELGASDAVVQARLAHRIVASTVLLAVVALLVLSLSAKPLLQREGRHALALLLLATFLAVLGRWSAGAPSPGVLLGNLFGGFLMFALSVRLAWPARPAGGLPAGWLSATTLGLLAVQLASGALGHPAHRFFAPLVAAALLWFAWRVWRSGRTGVAGLLGALLVAQGGLGLAQFALGLPVALVLAHNLAAMMILTLVLRETRLPGLDPPRSPFSGTGGPR